MSESAPLPRSFGRYLVVDRLGAGAMGAVYLAEDELLRRRVAVKTIHAMHGNALAQRMFRERFFNEARAIAALAHPGVVRVFDLGVEGDTPFLVMEVVEGRSLKERLAADGKLLADDARQLGVQLARALGAAHVAGILHRDIKPANVLEAETGWKLADFGVAHVPSSDLTLAGQFVGSPTYAAPEALEGKFSSASDVYALGATLFEALAGRPPFVDESMTALFKKVGSQPAPRIASLVGDIPPDLDATIARTLAIDPAQRPTVSELASLLAMGDSAARPAVAVPAAVAVAASVAAPMTPRQRRNLVLALAGAGVVALVIIIGVVASSSDGGGNRPTSPAAAPTALPFPAAAPSQPPALVRDQQQQKRWSKAVEKFRKGDMREAEEKLLEYLHEYPGDPDAEALLSQVRASDRWDDD